jgi:predicted dehydrogenase
MHVLFTGLGSIGRRHLRLLRDSERDVTISAYRHRDAEGIDGVTEYTSLAGALDGEPDVAFITNPTFRHVDTALACAEAGCDLFIEKPLSHTREGIETLLDAVEQRDLITYMGCQHRFNPVLQQVADLLAGGDCGTVYSFRATAGSYLPDWRPGQDYRESYSADPEQGGGVVLDLIHELDYTHWLFGEVTDVTGNTGQCSSLEIDTEDTAEIVLETEAGSIGSVHLDYVRPVPRRTLEVVCADGIVEGDLRDGTVSLEREGGTQRWSFNFERDDLFRAQLESFFHHVESREPCANDIREGKRVLEIALAAKEGNDGK